MPITYRDLMVNLRKWLDKLGKNSAAYSSHSLRRGHMTLCHKKSLSGRMIQELDAWSSECCFTIYTILWTTRLDAHFSSGSTSGVWGSSIGPWQPQNTGWSGEDDATKCEAEENGDIKSQHQPSLEITLWVSSQSFRQSGWFRLRTMPLLNKCKDNIVLDLGISIKIK